MKKLIILILLFPIPSHAFNWKKCQKTVRKFSFFFPISSTTTSLSSVGDCSLIGIKEHDKKVFLVQNIEQIKDESSRGHGEFLTTYATLCECNNTGKKVLPRLFQENYTQIFGSGEEKAPKAIYESMEGLIQSNLIASKNCNQII